jgi:hypothetical protein
MTARRHSGQIRVGRRGRPLTIPAAAAILKISEEAVTALLTLGVLTEAPRPIEWGHGPACISRESIHRYLRRIHR